MITVNRESMEWSEGMTIRALLELKNYIFPMLVIKVNGRLVRKREYDTYVVEDGDDVVVLHMISGG